MESILNRDSRVRINDDKPDPVSGEKVKRSLVKTISWRIIGTIDTVLIAWLITGTLTLAFSIGAIELISKLILYYFHERVWNKIKWGNNDTRFRKNK